MSARAAGMVGPLFVLAALLVGFAAYVTMTMAEASVRFATHFGAGGEPNGWMAHGNYLGFMLGLGIGLPLLMVAVFWMIAKFGGRGLNIPNKEFWLAPERREASLAFVCRQGVWFACIETGFFAAIHHLVLAANEVEPPRLPTTELSVIVGCFLAAIGLWVFVLLRRFRRPRNDTPC